VSDDTSKDGIALPELEQLILDEMCKQFRDGALDRTNWSTFGSKYGITDKVRAHRLFRRLIALGAVEEKDHSGPGQFTYGGQKTFFQISPMICEIADDVRRDASARREPEDRVDSVTKWARSHRVLSVLVVLALVAGFTITVANQALEFIERLGVGRRP
jgi:hypothetical protein